MIGEWWVLVIYFLLLLIIGYVSSRKESDENFLIADRKVNVLTTGASLSAGLVGGGVLVTTAALSFQYGLGFMWFYIGAALAFFTFPFIGKKIKFLADKKKFYTLSDYFYDSFDYSNGFLSAIIVFLMFFSLILVQFIAGGKVLSAVMNISYQSAVLLVGLIVLGYLLLGGFKAVIKTDLFQYILMLFLGLSMVFFIKNFSFGSFNSSNLNLFSLSPGLIISFVLFGAIPIYAQADVWQRAYSAKNYSSLKKGFWLAGVFLLILGLAIGFIGLQAKLLSPNLLPDQVLIFGFTNLLPSVFAGFVLVLLFSSIMSTLDTSLFVTAMNFSNDFLFKSKKIKKKSLVKVTRYSLLVISLMGLLLALFIQNIISVVFALVSLGLALAPAILVSLFFKLKNRAVFISVLSGLLTMFLLFVFGFLSEQTAILVLPVSILFLILGQIFFKK